MLSAEQATALHHTVQDFPKTIKSLFSNSEKACILSVLWESPKQQTAKMHEDKYFFFGLITQMQAGAQEATIAYNFNVICAAKFGNFWHRNWIIPIKQIKVNKKKICPQFKLMVPEDEVFSPRLNNIMQISEEQGQGCLDWYIHSLGGKPNLVNGVPVQDREVR